MSVPRSYIVKSLPGGNTHAGENKMAVSPDDFAALQDAAKRRGAKVEAAGVNLLIGDKFVYLVFGHPELKAGELGMNMLQRTLGGFELDKPVEASLYEAPAGLGLDSISISIDLFVKKAGRKAVVIEFDNFKAQFQALYNNHVFNAGQRFLCIFDGTVLEITVEHFTHISEAELTGNNKNRGMYSAQGTGIEWAKKAGSDAPLTLNGNVKKTNSSLFKQDFSFESLGIGGLDKQFSLMFKDVFASRLFPGLYSQLGFSHVKGMLLYGPPGCGKTLIARQIGKILNAKEPKIVNGPEILDKFVGGSEEKIRALFADAEKEQKERGDASDLHIIILDEMDAIMKSRGSTRDNTGVQDSIVNQFLSKIDGVDALNNVLIIGMTNRKDMIDEAVLRPGRLEIHLEISLPDLNGRVQILNIKTHNMRSKKRITEEAIRRMPEIAQMTKNFTGAEIEGMVKRATNIALNRAIADPLNLKNLDDSSVVVQFDDFVQATHSIIPAFGNKSGEEIAACYQNGFSSFGDQFDRLWDSLQRAVTQMRNSTRTSLMSILLEGAVSTGKTAIAAKLAAESDFPFIRMISADSMIGYSEAQVCTTLLKVFTDSYRSSLSIIFIDDIERIIQFTPVGQRFSNTILQTLLILLKKAPPTNSRLMVVGTTAISHLMDDLQLTSSFSIQQHVPQLESPEEFALVLRHYSKFSDELIESISHSISQPIGLKQFILIIEMAATGDDLSVDSFLECVHIVCR